MGERTEAGRHVLHAEVIWEDQDRDPHELRVEVPHGAVFSATATPAVFLPIVAVAAHVHGEARLQVDGPVDRSLVEGVADALTWFSKTDRVERPPLVIDASDDADTAPTGSRTMALLSGGVDSSAALLHNHATYPPTHPRRIDVALVVYGLDESTDGDIDRPDDFLTALCDHHGIELIPVRTNVRELDPTVRFWWDHAQSATWAGLAHAFQADVRDLVIGADSKFGDDAAQFRGSHPILDAWFSSNRIRIGHGAGRMTRLQRLGLVATSAPALTNLQVCNAPRAMWDPLNCGRCEKCQRTMLALASLGALDQTSAFPPGALTRESVASIQLGSWTRRQYYETLLPGLRTEGRDDLVAATRLMLRRSRRALLPKQFAQRAARRLPDRLRR